ncbi:MAG TPA: phosphoenolpyruvate--protein phosphotransferase [Blastocatellia bacterium]|nr:phosphoenolpyruvate--protein phosphotransferase [Blastocatellia bacterium]
MASSNNSASRDLKLQGIAASPGIALATVLRLDERGRHQFYYIDVSSAQVRREVRRLNDALDEARSQLKNIKVRLDEELGYEHSYILDAHLLMLEDKRLLAEIEHEITSRRVNAEWAVRSVMDRAISIYKQVEDAYLRERTSDLEDIATRLLTILSGHDQFNLSKLDQDVVIVAKNIWPSTVAELDFKHVLGFATTSGGLTSHSAIIARALGIPAVVGVTDLTRRARTGNQILIDGSSGEVILRPSKAVVRLYLKRREEEEKRTHKTRVTGSPGAAAEESTTLDGVQITLRANVELPGEIASLRRFGARGIGLYRSEFMFLNRLPDLPSEQEQYELYRSLAEASGEDGANIRVFDLGGDKLSLPGFEAEQNPALGLRAIRLSLISENIFKTQLRAILRANAAGRLRVVFPLISTINELREVKKIIAEVKSELTEAGVEHNGSLPMGVMIEVPAAALMVDLFARESDFLSIGTNDLIQYLLAVDRANGNVAHLYQPLHPAVLRTINWLSRAAREARVPIELCGEMAADPIQAIVLIGLGIRTLSLAPPSIPLVKRAVRSIECKAVASLMKDALKLGTATEVEDLLKRELPRQAPRFFSAPAMG